MVIGPGNGAVGPEALLDRAKIELKAWVVKEPRRGRADPSFWLFSLLSLLDILAIGRYGFRR